MFQDQIVLNTLKEYRSRLIGLMVLTFVIALVAKSDTLFNELEHLLKTSEVIIGQHPIAGMLLFVLLSALSAMLAFFSSAILVPVGVHTWGMATCFVLLWTGWLLGGLFAYAVGYFAGGSVASLFLGKKRLHHLKQQLSHKAKFVHILLFQAALPSEVPGYVLGTLKYRLDYYLLALGLTELPYALGTVYLGESFLQRNLPASVIIIAVGAIFALIAFRLYRQHFTH